MNKKYLPIMGLTIVLLGSALAYMIPIQADTSDAVNSPILTPNFHPEYNVEITHLDGTGNILSYQQNHNVLTDAMKNAMKDCFGQGACSGNAWDYIAVGNGTAPVSGSTTLANEITDCGLGRTQGTYTSIGTGNWSVYKLFTSTCDNLLVNSTATFNASSSGVMFMGDNFTDVTLQNTHQLNITITKWVS